MLVMFVVAVREAQAAELEKAFDLVSPGSQVDRVAPYAFDVAIAPSGDIYASPVPLSMPDRPWEWPRPDLRRPLDWPDLPPLDTRHAGLLGYAHSSESPLVNRREFLFASGAACALIVLGPAVSTAQWDAAPSDHRANTFAALLAALSTSPVAGLAGSESQTGQNRFLDLYASEGPEQRLLVDRALDTLDAPGAPFVSLTPPAALARARLLLYAPPIGDAGLSQRFLASDAARLVFRCAAPDRSLGATVAV